jgi:nucleotide-binding universal stress UspA family protein
MIKSILVPTDGSPNGKIALEYGLYLASEFEAEISGLNILDIRALEGPFLGDISGALGFTPYQNYVRKIQEILEERGNIILNDFKKLCEEKSIQPKIKRLSGIIPNIIAEEAKKVDLIVMAQRGEHAQWSSGLLGSTTESVVRKSPRPVLVTSMAFRPFKTVLHACDGSSESNKALKLACELVYSMKLKLNVIIVVNNEEKGRKILTETEEFIAPYHLDAHIEWIKGESAKEILKYAENNNVDLIVMGTFGHGRIHELILGGTTAYVIRKSTLPVLLNR